MAEKKTKEELEKEEAIRKEKAKNKRNANRAEKEKREEITSQLKEIGVYSEEQDETISLLAKKYVMMDKLWSSITENDFIFSQGTAAGNPKGNPETTLFLNLAKAIETHQEKLGLTPSGYLTLTGTSNTTQTDSKAMSNAMKVDAINEKIDLLMNKDKEGGIDGDD